MPVVRVYVPAGRAELDALADGGALAAAPDAPRIAYAVTPGLSALGGGADVEELEYAAFCDAAAAASAVRARPGDRRVVVAADADPASVLPPGQPGSVASVVLLVAALPLDRVASLHVDGQAADEPVTDARVGDAHGVNELGTDEMMWHDVTELDEVRRLLSPPATS